MFSRPFRVKSNTMMRNSDKRRLRADIEALYGPGFVQAADSLLPAKAEITQVAVVLHRDDETFIYCVDGAPMFFVSQPDQVLLPTVYALWKHPGLARSWFTWPAVVSKLRGGADLMLPGVIMDKRLPDGGLCDFRAKCPISVATPDNMASVAVGITALKSTDLAQQLASSQGVRGKGVYIAHTVHDHLWLFGKKTPRPDIPISEAVAESEEVADTEVPDPEMDSLQIQDEEGAPSGSGTGARPAAAATESEAAAATSAATASDGFEKSPAEVMDELLERCYLLALACRLRKSDLPMLTSKFYGTHMQSCCQDGEVLDIKRSSHKKLSRFLAAMKERFNCMAVKELSKGVDSITDVDWANPALRQAKSEGGASLLPASSSGASVPAAAAESSAAPSLSMYLSPSVGLLPVFSAYGFGKDSLLSDSDIRQVITQYVRDNELVSERDRGSVLLNDMLSKALRNKGELAPTLVRWDELMGSVKSKMLQRHQITTSTGISVVRKGNVQPVTISTAMRTGNKTVTLIDNAELYGIEAKDLAERMQHIMASSASVQNKGTKGKADRQVLVQGNAVKAVTELLREHYHVPQHAITIQQGKAKKSGGGKGKR